MRYVQNANHSYMILEGQQNDYQMKMLLANQIHGLLPVTVQQTNQKLDFYYEISGKTSFAKHYQERQFHVRQIRLFFLQLQHIISTMQPYLLDENRLLLSPEQIYIQEKEEQVYFVFSPCQYSEKNFQKSLRECVEFMIKRVNHEDELSMKMAYQIFHVTVQEYFRLEDILDAINYSENEQKAEKVNDREIANTVEKEVAGEKHENSEIWDYQKHSIRNYMIAVGLVTAGIIQIVIWKNGGMDSIGEKGKILTMAVVGLILCMAVGILLIRCLKSRKRTQEMEKETRQENNVKKEHDSAQQAFAFSCGACKDGIFHYHLGGSKSHMEDSENRSETAYQTDESIHHHSYCDENSNVENGVEFVEEVNDTETAQGDRKQNHGWQETTMLGIYNGKKHQLLSHEPMRCASISLEVYPFVIGKEKENCQVVLPVSTISRIHAKLLQRGEQVLLYDCNSRNGTWVNGEKIDSIKGVELKAGDEVKFADVEFTFL